MTRRIYYTDSYRRSFAARVVERADGGRRVYLDETAFYPTSGGQPNDTGRLGGIPVIDVIDEGERVAHLLGTPLPPSDDSFALVTGEIDWPRRMDHMQQHTGQHLLSALLDDLYGWRTVSVHFGAEEATLDVDAAAADVTRERLDAAEHRANEVIAEDRTVAIGFEDAAAAAGLRKPSDRDGEIRVVTIDGIDRSACGGTHVRSTGGIGVILIGGVESVRRQARVSFRCGFRVVRQAHADRDALERIAAALSASVGEAPELVAKAAEELRELRSAYRSASIALVAFRAREMLAAAEPDPAGIRRVTDVRSSASADELRALAQAMSNEPRVVYLGASSDPPFVVFAASDGVGLDAGRTLREALVAERGRGGGSPRAAQGVPPDAAAVARVVERLQVASRNLAEGRQ